MLSVLCNFDNEELWDVDGKHGSSRYDMTDAVPCRPSRDYHCISGLKGAPGRHRSARMRASWWWSCLPPFMRAPDMAGTATVMLLTYSNIKPVLYNVVFVCSLGCHALHHVTRLPLLRECSLWASKSSNAEVKLSRVAKSKGIILFGCMDPLFISLLHALMGYVESVSYGVPWATC